MAPVRRYAAGLSHSPVGRHRCRTGRSGAVIAERLSVTEQAIAEHTSSVFTGPDRASSHDDNHWVSAVLAHVER